MKRDVDVNQNGLNQTQAAEKRFLNGIDKITRRDRIRNEIKRESIRVSLKEIMERRRIQCQGYVKKDKSDTIDYQE